jgi:hypothetical protein
MIVLHAKLKMEFGMHKSWPKSRKLDYRGTGHQDILSNTNPRVCLVAMHKD